MIVFLFMISINYLFKMVLVTFLYSSIATRAFDTELKYSDNDCCKAFSVVKTSLRVIVPCWYSNTLCEYNFSANLALASLEFTLLKLELYLSCAFSISVFILSVKNSDCNSNWRDLIEFSFNLNKFLFPSNIGTDKLSPMNCIGKVKDVLNTLSKSGLTAL